LKGVDRFVEMVAQLHTEELVEGNTAGPLDEAVGVERSQAGAAMLNVVKRQLELSRMLPGSQNSRPRSVRNALTDRSSLP